MERLARHARQYLSHLTIRRLVVAGLLYWTPVLIAIALLHEVMERDQMRLDTGLLEWLHGYATPGLDWFMTRVTNLAGAPAIVLAGVSIGAVLFWQRRSKDVALLCAGLGGAVIINAILKVMLHRARPHLWPQLAHEATYSFPSAHAMMSSALAITLIIICWPGRWRLLALCGGLLYVLVIGVSRLYIGVHFPTDILAGWCMSLVWVLIASAVTSGRWFGLDRPNRTGSGR